MGKGDRKTTKGKRYNSSYGNARLQVAKAAAGAGTAPVVKKTTKGTTRKVVAKKTLAKE